MAGEGAITRTRCLLEIAGGAELKSSFGDVTPIGASTAIDTGLKNVRAAFVTFYEDINNDLGSPVQMTCFISSQLSNPGQIVAKQYQPSWALATGNYRRFSWFAIGE